MPRLGKILGHSDLGDADTLEAEVVIVGSGAGGAAAGWELAARGVKVVMVEEGFYWDPNELQDKPSWAYANLYQEKMARVARGPVFIPIPGGKAVGGSTLVNEAIVFRAPAEVLSRWQKDHGIDWASRAELDPIYDRLWKALGIAETTPAIGRKNNAIAHRGFTRLGTKDHGYMVRNAPTCIGCGICRLGCPAGGKASMDRSLIPESLDAGMTLVHGCRVDEIRVEGKRATGISGSVAAKGSDASRKRLAVKAGKVILAGSAIGTPILLQRQKLANANGQVGQHLHIHPGTAAVALFEELVEIWDGVPQGYWADVGGGLMLETFSATPEVFFGALPMGAVSPLEYKHLAACGVMIADDGEGTVEPGSDGKAAIHYEPAESDRKKLVRGAREICRMLFAAGARKVFPLIHGASASTTEAEALASLPEDMPLNRISMQASHPQGTTRMGNDPRRHVVRPDGRTHEVEGLYVADGSLFPGALGVNPQVTIMAFAIRIAQGIVAAG
jgi:choline dehydrogenase-like flavoprotein